MKPWRRRAQQRVIDAHNRVREARAALQSFWGEPGFRFEAEMTQLLRSLTAEELAALEAWIPQGGTGTTSVKTARAREIVRLVRQEK